MLNPRPQPLEAHLNNYPPADYNIAVIKHRRLSRGNCALRLVEAQSDRSAIAEKCEYGGFLCVIAGADSHAQRFFGRLGKRYQIKVSHSELRGK